MPFGSRHLHDTKQPENLTLSQFGEIFAKNYWSANFVLSCYSTPIYVYLLA